MTDIDLLTSQGDSLRAPPPSFPYTNGHINNINMIDVDNKKSAVDVSNELSRRVMELGKERSVEPESSMGHLQVEINFFFFKIITFVQNYEILCNISKRQKRITEKGLRMMYPFLTVNLTSIIVL